MTQRASDTLLDSYDRALAAHGDTAAGALWPNEADRLTRFAVMAGVIPANPGTVPAICDFACGTGELLGYLRANAPFAFDYVGADRSEAAIAAARRKFPDARFAVVDASDAACDLSILACDYLVIDGLFCVKFELSYGEMWSFFVATLRRLWPYVRRGIAFNVMSKIVDWERDDLFHVPMDDVARLLHELAGRNVRFRADYGLREYTAYAYRPKC